MKQLITFSFLLLSSLALNANEAVTSTKSWNGGEFFYPSGKPEITSIVLNIEKDQVLPYHCHPIPVIGHILEGTLEVETINGKKILLKKGDPVTEVMRTIHRSSSINGEVELVVFYLGAEGVPNTVLASDELAHKYCDSPRF